MSKSSPDAVLRRVAGPGARNCGIGRDSASDHQVYDCGARSIALGTPFFCHFDPWPSTDRVNTLIGDLTYLYGYAYSPNGSLFAVQREGNRGAVAEEVWRKQTGAVHRLSMDRGMKSPILDDLDGLKLQADQLPSQRVFVVLVISAPGVVEDVRVYKAVSGDAARAVEGALRGHACRPALLFGIPVPVVFYTAFDISRGTLRVFRPQPDRARA